MASWILLLPLRLIADLRYSALLLDNPAGARKLGAFCIVGFVLVVVHIGWAIFRGGRIRHFAWPAPVRLIKRVRSGGMFAESRDRFFDWIEGFDGRRLAMLGLRELAVAFAWLVIPISMMVIASRLPEGAALLLSVLAGVVLATVLIYLPFLQINAAVDNSMRTGLDVARVRRQFRGAPIAYWLALVLTLVLAIPLYVLKAELIPREAAWLPSIVFVMSILPARLFAAWAVSRGERSETQRHWVFRYSARLFAIPVVITYVFVVYLTQYVSWYGVYSLYEQHAFLLPVPFIGL